MQYIRSKSAGGTFFFTLVTYQRRIIFNADKNVRLLKKAFKFVKDRRPFSIDTIVILPDHLHCILTLPLHDCDFSNRIMLVKNYFTRHLDEAFKNVPTSSRIKKREQCVWQRRFWEHQIRNQKDFIQHIDYIHYNPVKHNLCQSPKDWLYSSFHKYVREGKYDINWGEALQCSKLKSAYE